MRDWTKTLMPSSYAGVPFWIERDNMTTGRRLDGVEIPGSDIPFFEDLGAKKRPIEIDGYFIGDVSDAQMTSLENACNRAGAFTLVMPAQGSLQARCDDIRRDRLRDKMGLFAFKAKFWLDPRAGGAGASAFPATYLAQMTFDANDNLGASLSGMLAGFTV